MSSDSPNAPGNHPYSVYRASLPIHYEQGLKQLPKGPYMPSGLVHISPRISAQHGVLGPRRSTDAVTTAGRVSAQSSILANDTSANLENSGSMRIPTPTVTGGMSPDRAAALFRAYDLAGRGWLTRTQMIAALSEMGVVHGLGEKGLSEVIGQDPSTSRDTRYSLNDFLAMYERIGLYQAKVARGERIKAMSGASTPPAWTTTSPALKLVFHAYCRFATGTSRLLVAHAERAAQAGSEPGELRMNAAQLSKLCQDLGLLSPDVTAPGPAPLCTSSVDVVFARCKPPHGPRRLSYSQWLRALAILSEEAGLDLFGVLVAHATRIRPELAVGAPGQVGGVAWDGQAGSNVPMLPRLSGGAARDGSCGDDSGGLPKVMAAGAPFGGLQVLSPGARRDTEHHALDRSSSQQPFQPQQQPPPGRLVVLERVIEEDPGIVQQIMSGRMQGNSRQASPGPNNRTPERHRHRQISAPGIQSEASPEQSSSPGRGRPETSPNRSRVPHDAAMRSSTKLACMVDPANVATEIWKFAPGRPEAWDEPPPWMSGILQRLEYLEKREAERSESAAADKAESLSRTQRWEQAEVVLTSRAAAIDSRLLAVERHTGDTDELVGMIKSQVEKLQSASDAVTSKAQSLLDRMDGAEKRLDAAAGGVTEATQKALQEIVQADVQQHMDKVKEQQNKMTAALEESNADKNKKIQELTEDLQKLQATLSQVSQEVQADKDRITAAGPALTVSDVQKEASTAAEKAVQGGVEKLQKQVEILTSKVNRLHGSSSGGKDTRANAAASLTELSPEIQTKINDSIQQKLEQQMKDMKESLATQPDLISAVSAAAANDIRGSMEADLNKKIADLDQQLSDVKSAGVAASALTPEVAEQIQQDMSSKLASAVAQVEEQLSTRVTSLEARVQELEKLLSDVQASAKNEESAKEINSIKEQLQQLQESMAQPVAKSNGEPDDLTKSFIQNTAGTVVNAAKADLEAALATLRSDLEALRAEAGKQSEDIGKKLQDAVSDVDHKVKDQVQSALQQASKEGDKKLQDAIQAAEQGISSAASAAAKNLAEAEVKALQQKLATLEMSSAANQSKSAELEEGMQALAAAALANDTAKAETAAAAEAAAERAAALLARLEALEKQMQTAQTARPVTPMDGADGDALNEDGGRPGTAVHASKRELDALRLKVQQLSTSMTDVQTQLKNATPGSAGGAAAAAAAADKGGQAQQMQMQAMQQIQMLQQALQALNGKVSALEGKALSPAPSSLLGGLQEDAVHSQMSLLQGAIVQLNGEVNALKLAVPQLMNSMHGGGDDAAAVTSRVASGQYGPVLAALAEELQRAAVRSSVVEQDVRLSLASLVKSSDLSSLENTIRSRIEQLEQQLDDLRHTTGDGGDGRQPRPSVTNNLRLGSAVTSGSSDANMNAMMHKFSTWEALRFAEQQIIKEQNQAKDEIKRHDKRIDELRDQLQDSEKRVLDRVELKEKVLMRMAKEVDEIKTAIAEMPRHTLPKPNQAVRGNADMAKARGIQSRHSMFDD